VRRFAWSADGTLGAFLYADLMVGIDPGVDVHALTDGISALTFGDDAETVYAVRVGADGGNDVAVILAIDQTTHEERELDRVSYPRPSIDEEAALAEAQFSDDGGAVRLYWMHDGGLRLWILGGGAWSVHPTDGNATELDDGNVPVLWAPDGDRRIDLAPSGNETRMSLVDRSGDELATATVTGLVSHLRWSPRGDQVVFTLGRSAPNGGVVQNLYLWNLGGSEHPAPIMITNTGAAFGAEWRGSQNRWEES
jgi:WD40 repeat protein